MKKKLVRLLIFFVVFLPFLIAGGTYYRLFVGALAVVSMYEMIHLDQDKKRYPRIIEFLAYLILFYFVTAINGTGDLLLSVDYRVLVAFIFLYFFPILILEDNRKYQVNDAFFLFGTSLLLGIAFQFLIYLRSISVATILFLLVVAILTDIFAYIGGSMIGSHLLAPVISPKKTIEGLVVGTLMGVFGGTVFYLTVIDGSISYVTILIVTVTLSLVGQLGDLVFSSMKRYYHQKDFSNMFSGYGGVMDFLDSFIFILFAYSILITMI